MPFVNHIIIIIIVINVVVGHKGVLGLLQHFVDLYHIVIHYFSL